MVLARVASAGTVVPVSAAIAGATAATSSGVGRGRPLSGDEARSGRISSSEVVRHGKRSIHIGRTSSYAAGKSSSSGSQAPATLQSHRRRSMCDMPRWRNPVSTSQRNFSSSSRLSASSVRDPYATLGVKRDASAKEIKGAYYDLAKKFHPDTSKEKGAKERFVEIQSAYDILSDDKKKAAFDRYGTTDGSPGFNPFEGAGGGGGGGFDPFGGGFGGFQSFGGNARDASDIFEGLFGAFGGGGGPRASRAGFAGESRGEDLETTLNITFEEACRGTQKSVTIAPVERCSTCEGGGMKKGAKKRTCQVCNGTGTRTFVIQSGFQMASTCPACGGAGQSVAAGDECGTCEGVGRIRTRKTVDVKIPPGVDDGAKIRMDGQGDVPLQGPGPAGSLYVRIGVRPSKIWRRQGSNLYFPATVPFYTAILGGKVRVPTLDGEVDVRVPAGTQVGDEMLLRGRGVPSLMRRGDKGDLLVQFEVTIPRSLSGKQREILQQYVDEVEGKVSASAKKPTATQSTAGKSENIDAKPNARSPAAAKAANTEGQKEQKLNSEGKSSKIREGSVGSQASATDSRNVSHDAEEVKRGDAEDQHASSSLSSEEKDDHSKGVLGKAMDWFRGR